MNLAYKDLQQPYLIKQVSKSKAYCMCGRSQNLPFCDDSHLVTNIQPTVLEFDSPRTIAICSCWKSLNRPFCDGTHGKLVAEEAGTGGRNRE